jgi:hypothetical protein
MGDFKGDSSKGNALGILIGGFFGVLPLELARGTSAGYAQSLESAIKPHVG